MWISVVIPTYNRLPILEKCLRALESQRLSDALEGFEVVVVDDGSTDGTVDWLLHRQDEFPHVRLVQQEHGGPAEAQPRRAPARGDVIVFIDDLVVTEGFLVFHAQALQRHCSSVVMSRFNSGPLLLRI